MVMISINKLMAVLPLPETALNKMEETENINKEPSMTRKEGMVASMRAASLVKMPSIRLGAMFNMNIKSKVIQKLKTEIFLIILKT